MSKNVTRRAFLRTAAVAGAGLVVAACQPKVVEVTKIVEKEVEKVVKETVVVEGTPKVIEKVVKETVVQKVVEKEQSNLMAKADDSAIVSAAGSGATVIEYWNGLTGEDGITMLKICQQFTQANPDVTIKTQRIPWGNYFDKLLPAIVAGAGPDLFILHRGELHEWKPKQVLVPLDDMFDVYGLEKDDFSPVVYNDLLYEGHPMGIPLDAYTGILWLNLDLLAQAGIEYVQDREPMTRDEFLKVTAQLTKDASGKHPGESGFDPKNVDVWGFSGGIVGMVHRQNGIDRVSMDGSCQALITDERYIDAITFARDLRWKYYVQPTGDFSATQALAAGKLGIFYNGSWFYNWFRDYPDTNWGVWYVPQWGAQKGVWNDSHCHCIHNQLQDANKIDWVKKLMKAQSDSHLWAAEAGMPTPRKSVAKHPQIAQNWALPLQLKQAEWTYPPNRSFPCGTEVAGILDPEVNAVVNNEKEPLAAMQAALPRVQQVLDRCCKK